MWKSIRIQGEGDQVAGDSENYYVGNFSRIGNKSVIPQVIWEGAYLFSIKKQCWDKLSSH